MKLSKIEYYNKLIELLDISAKKLETEDDIRVTEEKNPLFLAMYSDYYKGVEIPQGDDCIELNKFNYIFSLRGTGNSSFANGWAIFSDLKQYLVKSNIFEDSETSRKAIYNNRIAYKLSKQINLPLAKYQIRKR